MRLLGSLSEGQALDIGLHYGVTQDLTVSATDGCLGSMTIAVEQPTVDPSALLKPPRAETW